VWECLERAREGMMGGGVNMWEMVGSKMGLTLTAMHECGGLKP
jgi:hypothetical protein